MAERETTRPIELLDPETWDVPASLSRDDFRGHTGWEGRIPCRNDDDHEEDDR